MYRETDDQWASFSAQELAVTLYVVEDGRVLLIHKKRGLGGGKINAPGGRLESGESFREAAIRETREEIGIQVANPVEMATLQFIFTNGYTLEVRAFTATDYSGEPIETDEADPFWCEVDRIPFDRMWADDILWLPQVLAGSPMFGQFVFADDDMLESRVIPRPSR